MRAPLAKKMGKRKLELVDEFLSFDHLMKALAALERRDPSYQYKIRRMDI